LRLIFIAIFFFISNNVLAQSQPVTEPLLPNSVFINQQSMSIYKINSTGEFIAARLRKNNGEKIVVRSLLLESEYEIPLPGGVTLDWYQWDKSGKVLYIFCQDSQGEMQAYAWDVILKTLTSPISPEWSESSSFGTPANFYGMTMLRFRKKTGKGEADFNTDDGHFYPVRNPRSIVPSYLNKNVPNIHFFRVNGRLKWAIDEQILFSPQATDIRQGSTFISFSENGSDIWFLSNVDRDKLALVQTNLKNGNTKSVEVPNVDIMQVVLHSHTKRPIGFFWERELPQFTLVDKAYQNDLSFINKMLSTPVGILDISKNDDYILVRKNQRPEEIFLFDRKKRQISEVKFQSTQPLPIVSKTNGYVFKTRDGLEITTYLTEPISDICMSNKCPMIVVAHGGPSNRDFFNSNVLRDWFSSRGYFVANVNYRGSSGFGKSFESLDIGNWGGKIQDDVLDAVAFLINKNKKIASDKIGIMGASFGGYIALNEIGLSNRFLCAASISGTADLIEFVESLAKKSNDKTDLFKRAGDPRTNEGRVALRDASPKNKIDQFHSPILLLHGTNDDLSNLESIKSFAQEASQRVPLTFVAFDGEGHVFRKNESKMSQAYLLEKFFSKCLGGEIDQRTSHLPENSKMIKFIDSNNLLEEKHE